MDKYLKALTVLVSFVIIFGTMILTAPKSNIDSFVVDHTIKIIVDLGGVKGSQWGTGTILDRGLVLTCAHLFPENIAYKVFARQKGQANLQEIKLLALNKKFDLALLQLTNYSNMSRIKAKTNWKDGDSITFVGNGTDDFIIGHSKITSLNKLPGKYSPVFLFPCDTGMPGFSGAGIFNDQGEVVGVFELRYESVDRCGAIPVKEVLDWFKNGMRS